MKTFPGGSKSFGAWNVHGLGSKLEDIDFVSYVNKFDFFSLLETWSTENTKINIPGYSYFHQCRQKNKRAKRSSGGIIFFYKTEYRNYVKKAQSKSTDVLWVQIDRKLLGLPKDLFICSAYISPSTSTTHKYAENHTLEILESEISRYSSDGFILLGGDLNARLGDLRDYVDDSTPDDCNPDSFPYSSDRQHMDKAPPNKFGRHIADLCVQANLRVLNGRVAGDLQGKFTCHQPRGSSTVDYIICSQSLIPHILSFHIKPLTLFSDHCMVWALIQSKSTNHSYQESRKISNAKPLPKQYKWNDKSAQKFLSSLGQSHFVDRLRLLCSNVPNNINSTSEIDDYVSEFGSILREAGDQSLCLKRVRKRPRKRQNKKWFDKTCMEMKREVKNIASLLEKNPSNPDIRGRFFKSKKEYKKLLKKKKRDFHQQIMDQLSSLRERNPSAFWNLINKLKPGKPNDDNQITEEEWVNHFKNLDKFPDSSTDNDLPSENVQTDFSTTPPNSSELDSAITPEELDTAVLKLKNNKSSGNDRILNEMLKSGKMLLKEPILHLFNTCLQNGHFPQEWSVSHIVPIHKSGDTSLPDNYRGISIISCLGKLFSSILNSRLVKYAEHNNLFQPHQAGFRQNFRTTDNLFVLSTLVSKYLNKNRQLYACFIDFSKAFDSVWRNGLLFKLSKLGIGGKFLKVIEGMYSKTINCVKSKNGLTETFVTNCGVRQGCNLSPTLFNLFLSDIVSQFDGASCNPPLMHSKTVPCLLYADDLVIFSESKQGLQHSLNNLENYCALWKLKVNLRKTKIIVFTKGGSLPKNCSLLFDNREIEIVTCYTYLGIIVSAAGTFKANNKYLSGKGLKALFGIKQSLDKATASLPVRNKLFDACVKPILLYGSEIWGALKSPKTCPIESVHLKFCKQALNVPRPASNLATRAELGRYPIQLEASLNAIKHFLRIRQNVPADSLQADALSCQLQLDANGNKCWASGVRKILEECGFAYIWRSQISLGTNLLPITNAISQRLKDIYIQTFKAEIHNDNRDKSFGNKLRTYRLFKTIYKEEEYLMVKNIQHRVAVTKLRISCHKLHIETGRHNRTPLQHRVCQFCDLQHVEDEQHFILHCKLYHNERIVLYEYIRKEFPYFEHLNATDKFLFLMRLDKPCISNIICSYIYTCTKKREDVDHPVSLVPSTS